MNRPYKTLIVENEVLQLNDLCELLDEHKAIFKVAAKTTFFNEARKILSEDIFDIAILDIYLDQAEDCYNLIETVGRDRFKVLAIATDKDNVHPQKAHTVKEPVVFFQKPYIKENVLKFIKGLNEKVGEIDLLEKALSGNQKKNNYIILLDAGMSIRVPYDNIYYLEAAGSCTKFIFKDEIGTLRTYTQSGNLGTFEDKLDSDIFVRSGRKHIVNSTLIYAIKRSDSEIRFDRQAKIPVVHYTAEAFKEWLDKNEF